jgi:hypothetical protein
MAIYFFSALSYSFVPWRDKVETARTIVENVASLEVYRITILSRILAPAF